ncbi:MAG: hypothetical protein RLY77_1473 [Pseudomonadota bacterium]|jgi:predicted small secreted protein
MHVHVRFALLRGLMWQVFIPNREVAMKRLFALLLLTVFVSATLTACNTVNGAGKDIKKVGEKIEGASSK